MKNSNRVEKTVGFSNIEKILKNEDNTVTYKGIKELKKDLEKDEKIKKLFENVKNKEEAIKVAKELGYKITEEEIENNEELVESMLEAVAGGSGTKYEATSYDFDASVMTNGNKSRTKTNPILNMREV